MVAFDRTKPAYEDDRFLGHDVQNALGSARAVQRDMLDLLTLTPGLDVLEVGCGTGDDARVLADHVGSTGRVVALDHSAIVLNEARRRTPDGYDMLTFAQGDAQRLDYADESFDRCYCERVLQHIADPALAIRELVRVTRPGGRIVVADTDWERCLCSDPTSQALIENNGRNIRNATLARTLGDRFREAGLREITVRPRLMGPVGAECDERWVKLCLALLELAVSAGAVSAADAAAWPTRFLADGRDGIGFQLLHFFVVAGTKPG